MGSLFKDSGSPPPPPDPTATAQAQSTSNIQTAIANARLNRINQTTPFGSIKYTQTGVDANGIPIYESNIALSPQQQQLLNQQQSGQNSRSQIANALMSRSAAQIATPLDFSSLHSVYDKYAPNQQWSGNPQKAPQPFELQDLPSDGPTKSTSPIGSTTQPTPAPQDAQSQQIDPAMLQQLVAMLRSGDQNSPQTASAPSDAATTPAAGAPGFGALGNLGTQIRESGFDGSKLPDWLKSQLVLNQVGNGGDDGGQHSQWDWKGEHPEGTFADEQGNPIIQIGNPDDWQKSVDRDYVKDPSKAKYRNDIGYYTTPDNIQQTQTRTSGHNMAMNAAIGAMFGGVASGLIGPGAAVESGAVQGAGTSGVGLPGSAGELAGNPYGPGAFDSLEGGINPAASGGFNPSTGLDWEATTQGAQSQGNILDKFIQSLQGSKSGSGALGLSNGQRAGVSLLLSQLLRQKPAQQQQYKAPTTGAKK